MADDMTPNALDALCKQWFEHKRAETAANKARVEIEEQIVALVGKKDKGATTVEIPGFKVTTTGKQTIKLDADKWASVKAQIPAELHPIKVKEELDNKGVEWLRENRADLYALLPIEITPAKTAVEVKVV